MEMYEKDGKIEVTHEVIATMAGSFTMTIPGVVGMVSVQKIKDGVAELLKRDQYGKGVVVEEGEDGLFVRLHIVVAYGTNIMTIATNVQRQVQERMNEVGLVVQGVHVCVESVQVNG